MSGSFHLSLLISNTKVTYLVNELKGAGFAFFIQSLILPFGICLYPWSIPFSALREGAEMLTVVQEE